MFYGAEGSLAREKELYKQGITTEEPVPEHELKIIEERLKRLGLTGNTRIKAKYKLEIHFGKNRTSRGLPFSGAMTYWMSGKELHGGGDVRVWECPKCEAIVDGDSSGSELFKGPYGKPKELPVRYCGKCAGTWPIDQLVEFRYFKLTEQDWAYAILKGFIRLGLDADIYVKYHPDDIRYKTMMELARSRGGEAINQARVNRGLHIYPLKNIIIDTKHGAGLYEQIRKFINA